MSLLVVLLLTALPASAGRQVREPARPADTATESDAGQPRPDTADLARGLFPGEEATETEEPQEPTTDVPVKELYPRLFPAGPPRSTPETSEPVTTPGQEEGVLVGPLRVKGGVAVRYMDADTFVETTEPARDRYVEVAPRVKVATPIRDGTATVEYRPFLRAFASYPQVGRTSHYVDLGLDLPLGPRVVVRANDSFVSGVLDTHEADPGGEYFFGLGHFRRNSLQGNASLLIGPRGSLEIGGGTSSLSFQEPSTFFGHETRFVTAGIGYELSPNLKTVVAYRHDVLPSPAERPEVAARAHAVHLTFAGDLTPLLSGQVFVGYRSRESPNAGEGGTRYRGLVMGGTLTKQFSRESSLVLYVSRSTPPSAFERNAFYVSSALQGSLNLPLPLHLEALCGLGYQWNDYRTVAEGIDAPRRDRILAWYAGLRRPLRRGVSVSASFRKRQRRSNLERFVVDSDGFILQLEWDIFGDSP